MDLKEALTIIVWHEHLGDHVYHVRDAARESQDGYKGDSWDHPRVKAWSNALRVVEDWLEENK